PEIPTQKKIAYILNTYDTKIENNNVIIKNLETMAQTIFNEWFVNFKFPGYEKVKMVDSEMGEIPEGWKILSLNTIAEVIFGFNFKAKEFNEEQNGIPVVRIRDVLSGVTKTFSPEIPKDEYKINSGDLLIGMDGTFHCSFWYSEGAYLNQRVARIRTNFPGYFIYESIRLQLDFLQKTITGATVGHLSNGDIRNFKILIPENELMLQIFSNITEKVLKLRTENISLKSQRDQLLEKLI
ncbi:MAG: restriction endonuclease subunit S, partial [Lutibacter sp.]|nr:restriction endonuclease subunit S [Lutibacter sp.]